MLAFLDPGAGDPPAQSPLEEAWAAAAVRTAVREGWRVPLAFGAEDLELIACRSSAGLADRSHLMKLELQGAPEVLSGVLDRHAGASPARGMARRTAGTWWCPLTPRRAYVVSEPGAAARALREALVAEPGLAVCDLTAGLAAITLLGPRAREVLARVCALDLRVVSAPPGSLRPGQIARVPGVVLCEQQDAYLLLVGTAHARYVWDTLLDAGGPLKLQRIGLTVLGRLLADKPQTGDRVRA